MRKKHIVRNLLLIVGGFILLLIILAEIFKERIVKTAIQKGAKTFDVPLAVGEVDFSLLYRFPYATIEFNNIVMLNGRPSDSLNLPIDTVAGISKLYASVDMMELTKGNILVKKIEIENVKAKYIVDSLGRSNFDFLLEGTNDDTTAVYEDTTKIQGVYALDKLKLKNIDLEYVDRSLNTSALAKVVNLEMNGEVEAKGFKAATQGQIVLKKVQYQNYNLNVLNNTKLQFNLTALNDTISISQLSVKSSAANLNLAGTFSQTDSAWVNMKIQGNDINLKENLSILPPKMLNELQIAKAAGILRLNGTAKGFVTANTMPQVDLDVQLQNGIAQYANYPALKNVQLVANFTNGYAKTLESTAINIKRLYAETAESKIDVSLKIQNPNHLRYDVSANVSLSLNEAKPFVPDSLVKKMAGNVTANITTTGTMPDSITDDFTDYVLDRTNLSVVLNDVSIQMDSLPAINNLAGTINYSPNHHLQVNNLQVKVPDYNFTLANGLVDAMFKGKISQYQNLTLQLDTLNLSTPFSSVAASAHIKGLNHIKYNVNTNLKLQLSEVKQMLPDSIAHSMSGSMQANFISAGEFNADSIADQAMALLFENSQFNVAMNKVFTNMPDTLMNVKMLSGQIKYHNDSIWMNNISGNYLGLDFAADATTISNVYTGAIQNNKKEIRAHGNFELGHLDYAWIDAFMTDTVALPEEEMQAKIKAKLEEEPYVQNFTIKANGTAKVKSFKYGDILAENIDSKFLADLEKMFFVAEDLTCNVFGGDAKVSVNYDVDQENPSIKKETEKSYRDFMQFKAEVKNLDVSRMMFELESYIGQDDFKKENVQGTLSGKMDGEIVLVEYNPVYEEMLLKGDIKLENGALINVKAVSDIEDTPIIKLEDMDKLYFSTLESKLFLFKNKMYFPRTNIKSSSFDAMFFGMYSFGEDYAYHLKMYLNQLLSKKDKDELDKMSKEKGFEEREVKDGKRPIYVVSKFEKGKSKAGLDNRPDRLRMDAKVKLQKQMVDMRFHPGLVIYSTQIKDEE